MNKFLALVIFKNDIVSSCNGVNLYVPNLVYRLPDRKLPLRIMRP